MACCPAELHAPNNTEAKNNQPYYTNAYLAVKVDLLPSSNPDTPREGTVLFRVFGFSRDSGCGRVSLFTPASSLTGGTWPSARLNMSLSSGLNNLIRTLMKVGRAGGNQRMCLCMGIYMDVSVSD